MCPCSGLSVEEEAPTGAAGEAPTSQPEGEDGVMVELSSGEAADGCEEAGGRADVASLPGVPTEAKPPARPRVPMKVGTSSCFG